MENSLTRLQLEQNGLGMVIHDYQAPPPAGATLSAGPTR